MSFTSDGLIGQIFSAVHRILTSLNHHRHLLPTPGAIRLLTANLGLILAAAVLHPSFGSEIGDGLHEIEFAVFGLKRFPGLSYRQREGELIPVTFYSGNFSARYTYRGKSPLRFFRAPERGTGELVSSGRWAVAAVDLQAPWKEVLFVFLPTISNDHNERYEILPLNFARAKLAESSLLITNVSGWELQGMVAQRRITLGHRQSHAFALPEGSTKVGFAVFFEHELKRCYQNLIRVDQDQRGFLFLFPPYIQGSTRIEARLVVETSRVEERE